MRLDDDSDEERTAEDELEGGAAGAAGAAGSGAAGGVAMAAQMVREAPTAPPPEEKKPTLTLEELEAKQGRHQPHLLVPGSPRNRQRFQTGKGCLRQTTVQFCFYSLMQKGSVSLEGSFNGRDVQEEMKRLAI